MLMLMSLCPAASSTGLIYIDPSNLRRSSAISTSAAAAAAALEASNSSSYLTSASSLARAYSIVIRQISDLMSLIPKYNHLVYSQYPAAVKLTYQDAVNLQVTQPTHRSHCIMLPTDGHLLVSKYFIG